MAVLISTITCMLLIGNSSARDWRPGPDWKPVDMLNLGVKPGSALDLRGVTAVVPDGQPLPRLAIGPRGRFVAKGSNRPIRLRGFTTFDAYRLWRTKSKDEVATFAKLARLQGYNLVRTMTADALCSRTDMVVEAKALDMIDYLISEMGKQGVYLHLTLCAYGLYCPGLYGEVFRKRNEHKMMMYLGGEWERKHFRFGAETLLNHVNPYTGKAWKDDPTIACVEFYNEQEGSVMWTSWYRRATPETKRLLNNRYREWLTKKYVTLDALRKAWGIAVSDFDQVQVPPRLLAGIGTSKRDQDFVLFVNDIAREFAVWCTGVVRATGYKGLTAQYNLPSWIGNVAVRHQVSQVAITNKYFCHPNNNANPGSRCRQHSSIGEGAAYWCTANATRLGDRPFVVTEFNHSFWNQYQYEGGILTGAYSALQGHDGLVIHKYGVVTKQTINRDFEVGSNPVVRANEFLSACLFLRGDVKTSKKRISLMVPKEALGLFQAVSIKQSQLGLMSNFTLAFPGIKKVKGVGKARPPHLKMSMSGSAEVSNSTGWSVDVKDTGESSFSQDAVVDLMKLKGLLPPGNSSKPSAGIYQSDTGEITLRTRDKLLKVVTPRTEAVALLAGREEKLGKLQVQAASTRGCVAICSVDGRSIGSSRRMVLLFITETANTGMVLSGDRVTMRKVGRLPALLKTGRLRATLVSKHNAALALYALGFDGTRRERISLTNGGNHIEIALDTSKLRNGPTPFFELVTE